MKTTIGHNINDLGTAKEPHSLSYLKTIDLKEKYENLVKNLDIVSVDTVNKIVCRILSNRETNDGDAYFTGDEIAQIIKMQEDFKNKIFRIHDSCYAYETYFLPIRHFQPCVFYDKHLLKYTNQDYYKNKDIIDGGGYIGDSAIIFSDYTTKNVYSFEPMKANYTLMLQTIQLNKKSNIIPENIALGDHNGTTYISKNESASTIADVSHNQDNYESCTMMTLDEYVRQNNLDVGLIKTDLEGFEQNFLKGAENTIKEQKPTLLISIYHNMDDFFNIKPIIESWDLGYKFKIIKPTGAMIVRETCLIAEINP